MSPFNHLIVEGAALFKLHRSCRAIVTAIALSTVLLAGCKELPNIKPFADAAAELKATVSKAKTLATNLFVAYSSDADATETAKTTLETGSVNLDKAWKTTDEGLAALVAYTDALAEVSSAGQSGDKAVKNLFGALDGLAQVTPLGPIAGLGGVQAVGEVLGKAIAQAKAAKDLKGATQSAKSAVDIAVRIIEANLETLGNLTRNTGRNYETAVYSKSQWVLQYHDSLLANERQQAAVLVAIVNLTGIDQQLCDFVVKQALKAAREKKQVPDPDLTKACDASQSSEYAARRKILREDAVEFLRTVSPALQSGSTEEVIRKADALRVTTLSAAQLNNAELIRIAPQYEKVSARMAEIRKSTDTAVAVFESSKKAAGAYKRSHDSLVKALEGDYTHVSFREFISFVEEAADAYKKGAKQ